MTPRERSPALSLRSLDGRVAWALFGVALAVRLLVLFRAGDSTEFQPTDGDTRFYHEWAQRIARGAWTDGHAFYGLPLYAYWTASIYGLLGAQPYLAVLPQTLAEAVTAMLLYRIGRSVFASERPSERHAGRIIGSGAALGWTFFVPAQTFAALLMPTAYLVLAFWAVVWWIVRPRAGGRAPGWWECAALGAGTGVTAMLVANILFLLPLVVIALWRWHRPAAAAMAAGGEASLERAGPWRRTLPAVVCVLAGVLIGTAPCWVHNRFVAKEPVFLSAHGGINFFLGNNPEANGYPRIPAGLHADQAGLLRDSLLVAERAAGRPVTRAEASAFWSAKAWQFIQQEPGAWLRLMAVKVRNFWSSYSYDDLSAIAAYREEGVTLPGPGFGLAAFLALPGALLAWGRWPRSRWIIGAVGLQMASVLTVFVTERYRLAAAPGLLLLGAAGLWGAGQAWRERQVRGGVSYAVALVAAAAFVFWPQRDASVLAPDNFNLALADLEAGRLDRAQGRLERALTLSPDGAEQHFALGNLWLARGDRDRAKGFYRRTLELDPEHERVLNNLGVLASEENRWPLAAAFFTRSLAGRPDDAKTYFLLARAQWRNAEPAAAARSVGRALTLQPDRPEFVALRDEITAAPPAPPSGGTAAERIR